MPAFGKSVILAVAVLQYLLYLITGLSSPRKVVVYRRDIPMKNVWYYIAIPSPLYGNAPWVAP